MLDSDHQAYYLLNDGVTIASVADILADPQMIVNQSVNGLDPVGFPAEEMALLYAQNASNLRYLTSGYLINQGLSLYLRPHEELVLRSQILEEADQKYDYGTPLSLDSVNSGQLTWDISFGQSYWRVWAYSVTGVDAVSDSSGTSDLQNLSTSPGNVIYRESTVFPVLALSVAAQANPGSGGLRAYISSDGVYWSAPVQFQPTTNISSYQLNADLSNLAQGQYSYYVKIELTGGMRLHKIRISPIVQTAKWIFPVLTAGSANQFVYDDASPVNRVREMTITTEVPAGSPQIRGLQAQSLVPEDPVYSLARDYGAANLVDGDMDSLAYPSARHIDYAIHLNGPHVVSGVSIDWGYFGSDARYLTNWTLLGSNGGQNWQVLASGGFPGKSTLDVAVQSTATDLRLMADGLNSIGAYEVRVFGTVIPNLPQSSLSVVSNILENPIYSLARGYQAAKLIDGNLQTLAYPANDNLDYQISLGGATQLSSASITWGYFGTNPIYVDNWSVLGRNGANQPWTTVAQGGFPNAASSSMGLETVATDLRLVAHSAQNNIGSYEFQLYGLPVGSVPVLTNLTATSNVPEDPIYCLARGYQASNLVDQNESTLAYPGGRQFDYTIDPGKTIYVDSIRAVWGYFGQNAIYINSWEVMGLPDGSDTWEIIAHGAFPNSPATTVPVKTHYRKLRITAESAVNAIGIYEAHVFGY